MKTLITVTASHLKRGQPKTLLFCAISLAVKSCLRRDVSAEVWPDNGVGNINLVEDATFVSRHLPLPYRADRAAERFDDGLEVQPFTFHLNIPRDMLRPSLRKRAT